MLEFIFFLIVFTVFSFLSISNTRLKNKNLELILILDQAIKDIELIRLRVNGDSVTEKEHLISFLNETRDVAYRYIEDVHKALLDFEDAIEFDLNNPSDLSVARIKYAFEKLKEIYPEDIPND